MPKKIARYAVASFRLTYDERAELQRLADANGISLDAWLYRQIFHRDKREEAGA